MFGHYALATGRGAHRHALQARAAHCNLPIQIATSDLLLAATDGAMLLHDDRTILIGQIFNRTSERLTRLPPRLADSRSAGDLRNALEGHWGNFALFFSSGEEIGVYREPSGSVPVYRCGPPEQTMFVSDADVASKLGLLEGLQLDEQFLIHWLQFPFLRNRRTALAGVTELLPGMFLKRASLRSWTESRIWYPSLFLTREQTISDGAQAASMLRETALSIVAAQSSSCDALLRLSGGLDSSIIAACLAQSGQVMPCVNFATRSRDGDERRFAREVAGRFKLHLVEIEEAEYSASLIPPELPSFRPTLNPLLAPYEHAIQRTATEFGSSLLIDGGGGDNIFCSITSAAPLLDAISTWKLRTIKAAVSDISLRANCSIWEVLSAAARRALKARDCWKEDQSFLVDEALLQAPELHPWLQNLTAAPGKHEHVQALVHIQHFLDRGASLIDLLHPLLAQPLLELCLRFPSWLWLGGGRDRAIARDAFAGLVPHLVLQRRAKGSLQSLLYRSFATLREDMGRLLREGELVRTRMIDYNALARVLTSERWKADDVQLRISEIVALELWLQSWRSLQGQTSNAL